MTMASQSIFESVGQDCDLVTKIYLTHMEEGFVKPYLAWCSQVLTEAEIEPKILNKMKSGLYAQKPKQRPKAAAVAKVLPPDQQANFAAKLPDADDSKPVAGFKDKAQRAIDAVKDATSKKILTQLMKIGLNKENLQQIALAGITGAAAVGVNTLTGGSAALTGGAVGGLVGITRAKMAGKSWKDAFISGAKAGLMGAAAGAVGGLAGAALSGAGQTAAQPAAQPAAEPAAQPAAQSSSGLLNPEVDPGAVGNQFTTPEVPAPPPELKPRVATNWKEIYAANTDIIGDDPDYIMPGEKLKMPDDSTYTVKKGDNLTKIAKIFSGGALRESDSAERLDEVTSEQFYDEAKARGYSDAQIKAMFDKFSIELPTTMPKGIEASKPGVKKPAAATGADDFKTGDPELDQEIADLLATQGKDAVIKMLKDVKASLSKAAATSDPYAVYTGELKKMPDVPGAKPLPATMAAKFKSELQSDLQKMAAGDKDSGAYIAQKILKFAKAGYDMSDAKTRWIATASKAKRIAEGYLSARDYRDITSMLKEHGFTWDGIGISVMLDESTRQGVFITRKAK
jgi:LysM repeat protein